MSGEEAAGGWMLVRVPADQVKRAEPGRLGTPVHGEWVWLESREDWDIGPFEVAGAEGDLQAGQVSGAEVCPVCKDWGPGTLALYARGCPRCGATAEDRDLPKWLRRQVEADLERERAREAKLRPGVPAEGEFWWLQAAEYVADCEAKLALLDAYAEAEAGPYDYRTGRASQAEGLWHALAILAGGYRHRDGWREHWSMPQAFQGN
jgi:hypothetical protein